VNGRFTRRRLIGAAVGLLAAGSAATAESFFGWVGGDGRPVVLGAEPAGLPSRQHAWGATLASDSHGNQLAPHYDRLLFFDVGARPDATSAAELEAALRGLERRFAWGPQGLLFAVGWGPRYFEQVAKVASPIPHPEALSDFELPAFDGYHGVVHLASDEERHLLSAENGLRAALGSGIRWLETRTGFAGAGLPAGRQNVGGIPSGRPVPAAAPLYMGFKSGLRKNQATEDAVTIPDGPLAGGTTMHVSYMRLRLDSWYRVLDERERVARMYAPQLTPDDVARLTDDARSDPEGYRRAASRYGVVGHSQTSARARRNGRPLILRRDFDTTDGGVAGLHFVALQRTIADFVTTRKAMNASTAAAINPAISDTVNNGINEFIFVLKRGNYVLPPRRLRSYPLLSGKDHA
jgi:hypothetical protein